MLVGVDFGAAIVLGRNIDPAAQLETSRSQELGIDLRLVEGEHLEKDFVEFGSQGSLVLKYEKKSYSFPTKNHYMEYSLPQWELGTADFRRSSGI